MTDEEKLKMCIETLKEIMETHNVDIIMGDRVVRDRAYKQAKECLDKVLKN